MIVDTPACWTHNNKCTIAYIADVSVSASKSDWNAFKIEVTLRKHDCICLGHLTVSILCCIGFRRMTTENITPYVDPALAAYFGLMSCKIKHLRWQIRTQKKLNWLCSESDAGDYRVSTCRMYEVWDTKSTNLPQCLRLITLMSAVSLKHGLILTFQLRLLI
jgi:hypothetical protein